MGNLRETIIEIMKNTYQQDTKIDIAYRKLEEEKEELVERLKGLLNRQDFWLVLQLMECLETQAEISIIHNYFQAFDLIKEKNLDYYKKLKTLSSSES